MSDVKIELAAVEQQIENEIEMGLTQRQIAQTYALGLRSSWPTDWARVNAAILKRWPKGLERIKKMAWSGKCFGEDGKEALKFGGHCMVPLKVATCPECDSMLSVRCIQWDSETGVPHDVGLEIECESSEESQAEHRWAQSDWQPVRDEIAAWCGAITWTP